MIDMLEMVVGDEDPGFVLLLKEMCDDLNGIRLLGVARSKEMLIAKINNRTPDLVRVDLTHDMGRIDVLQDLRNINPDLNIVVTYHPDHHDSDLLVSALEMGVYECIEKPLDKQSRQYQEFRLHFLTLTGLLRSRKRFAPPVSHGYKNKFFMPQRTGALPLRSVTTKDRVEIVVIASSTGGPEILSQIFSILPGNLKVPILLVQHIPAAMTHYFAKSLNAKSELSILQAGHGDELQPGTVLIAPGGQHMTVTKPDGQGKRKISLDKNPSVNSVRPSADVLFESVARSYNGHILAVVLTGMGEDGKKGVEALKTSGCICLTQKAETCVVYGMPRAVDEAGLSDESLDPLSITQKIVMLVQ